jgi:hypothetical protein
MRWLKWKYWQWILTAVMLLSLFGAIFIPALAYLFVVAIGASGLAFAIAELFWPASFLRWRASQLAESWKWQQRVGRRFDRALGIDMPRPWDAQRALSRVRRLGVVTLIGTLAAAGGSAILVWWILERVPPSN